MAEAMASQFALRSPMTGANNGLALALLIIAGLAPLPLGSVGSLYWGFSAAAIGVLAILYGAFALIRREPHRALSATMRIQVTLTTLMLAYLVVQILPLGKVFGPFEIVARDGVIQSNTISLAPGMTVLMIMRQFGYALFFYLMLQCARNPGRRMLVLDGVLAIAVAYAFAAIISLQAGDQILGMPKWAYLGVATGTFVNRNSLATFLALGACIAASGASASLMRSSNGDRRARGPRNIGRFLIYGGAFVLLLLTIAASQSRMGLFVALSGAMVALVCNVAIVRDWRPLAILMGLAFAAILAGLFVFGNDLFDRFLTTEDSAIARADLYRQVIDLIMLRPWLGMGGGSFELAFPLVHQEPLSTELVWDRAHNTYLTLWSELGIVFGSIPILVVALTGLSAFRVLLSNADGGTRIPAATVLAAITAVALHSLVDFSLEIQAVTYLFLAILACGAAAAFDAEKKKP